MGARAADVVTLLPAPKVAIEIYHGETVVLQEETVCCHPACWERWGLQTHHVVRRSETGGPVRWVLINGVVLLNERRVCTPHHRELTGELGGHLAWIRYLEGESWVWYAPAPAGHSGPGGVTDKLGAIWLPVGPLKGVM